MKTMQEEIDILEKNISNIRKEQKIAIERRAEGETLWSIERRLDQHLKRQEILIGKLF